MIVGLMLALTLFLAGGQPAFALPANQAGCCECSSCSGPTACADLQDSDGCPAFCEASGCDLGAFSIGIPCTEITPCEVIAGPQAPVPALSVLGLGGAALVLAWIGLRSRRRRVA